LQLVSKAEPASGANRNSLKNPTILGERTTEFAKINPSPWWNQKGCYNHIMSSVKTPNPKDAAGLLPKHDRTAWLKGGGHRCLLPPRTPVGRVWRIVLLGAPGVGKDAQADLLCERLGTCHLSTGDIFRIARCSAESQLSPAMHNALEYLKRGESVSDEAVLNLVGERLRCLNCPGGFLLDGFPRTVAQAKALEQFLDSNAIKLTAVFNYVLPLEQIVARISGRRTCSNCKTVYHTATHPPTVADVCGQCGGSLFQREDERPAAVKLRLETYEHFSRPLISFYQERGLLINIPADGTPEEVYERTRKVMPPD
jgi:adenylate kinase